MKLRTGALVALAVLGATSVATINPAGAGSKGGTATLTVTKTVEGTPPAGTEFVINVFCIEDAPNDTVDVERRPAGAGFVVYDEDITFGPGGGEEEFVFTEEAECTIIETDDGGADEVINRETEVLIEDPTFYEVEVTNIFAADVTTTTAPATTTTPAVAAAVAAPRFTG